MQKSYLKDSGNKYLKIHRSAMRERHFSRGNINEYFHKRNNIFSWQAKVLFLFFIFIFIYLVYFFFFSNYFKINQIIVEGNKEISTAEIRAKCTDLLNKRRFLFLKNDNYFLFDTEKVKETFSKDYLFDKLEVDKKYFSTIFISLKEKPYKLFYVIDKSSFLIDSSGIAVSRLDYEEVVAEENSDFNEKVIIKEVPEEAVMNQEEIDEQEAKIVRGHELYQETNSTSTVFIWENTSAGMIVKEADLIEPNIEDVYPELPEIGSKVFPVELVENILYLDSNYNQKFGENREYYKIQYEKKDFLSMLTSEDYYIYFKLDENIDSQLSNLYRYLIEEDNDLTDIEYIDLRQKDQIIIK